MESAFDIQSERKDQATRQACTNQRTNLGLVDGSLFRQARRLAVSYAKGKAGNLTTVAKQFRDARSKAGLPRALVLYRGRHTFAAAAYGATGNLAMVMNVMGHTAVRTAMRYQHPVLDSVRETIDQRNLRHKPRHNELRVQ